MSVGVGVVIIALVVLYVQDEIIGAINRMNAKLDRVLERMGFDDGK